LVRSPLVTEITAADTAMPTRPFVLEGDHLYLLRNYRAEVEVAQALRARRQAAYPPRCPLSDDDLRTLFNGRWTPEEERQRAAVRQAVGKRLMVLTGGPGTGKTTTVLRMLLGLSREHQAVTGRLPQLRMAAPTGKAAQRLVESLQQGAQHLRSSGQPLPEVWLTHLEVALSAEVSTVHRLLGSRGRHGRYTFGDDTPLLADILVVDEASMLDLGLLRTLLTALHEQAVLVLVGDADQLTSVGTGSIMMDIVRALEEEPRGDLVRLSHCFRAETALASINEAVRLGDVAAFDAAMRAAESAASILSVQDATALGRPLSVWAQRWRSALMDVGIATPVAVDDAAGLTARLAVLQRQQLLCALREGPLGALQVARRIDAQLRHWDVLADWSGNTWYPGRCVMITRNDYATRLFNGDVGICILVADGNRRPTLQVAFASHLSATHAEGAGGVRLFDPHTLPPHEDAFAITVHKSQGSEYQHVAVLLPPEPDSPLLVRQLLYTALSRAKAMFELWATPAAIHKALTTSLLRHGRLAERIQGRNAGYTSHLSE